MAYRLLLADDSITIQKVVELTLSDENFIVTSYGDGEAALEAARKSPPDIILADVFMPRMNGYELCGSVRQDPALKDVPVLLMVGTFESFDEAAAARAGADDRITKPFESYELISKINRLIEMRAASIPEGELMAELVEEAEPLDAEPIEAEPIEEAEPVFEAGLVEEAGQEEVPQPEPPPADDLWSVVDLHSETQPISGATEILTEEELWRRAELISEPEGVTAPAGERGMPWDELSGEPVMEAEEVEEPLEVEEALIAEEYESFPEVSNHEGPEAEATAVLDLDEIDTHGYADDMLRGEEPIEVAEPYEQEEMLEAESLDEAVVEHEVESSRPATEPVPTASLSPEHLKEEIIKSIHSVLDEQMEEAMESLAPHIEPVISSLIDQKIKDALSAISRDVIERVVWDVVPGLAEEIIVKEIEKLKAGVK